MDQFRGRRNWADYDLTRPMHHLAASVVAETVEVIRLFDALPSLPDTQAEIVEAIKKYEKEVLREETWKTKP
jgi:NTP pyrophosphatase (non-canonical NTP hydrolase)